MFLQLKLFSFSFVSFKEFNDPLILFCFDFPMKQICHRDLKLENTLLDGSPAPRLKICDFGYSKVLFLSRFVLLIPSLYMLQRGPARISGEHVEIPRCASYCSCFFYLSCVSY